MASLIRVGTVVIVLVLFGAIVPTARWLFGKPCAGPDQCYTPMGNVLRNPD